MSVDVSALVSDNLDLWTGAIGRKPGAGRGGGRKVSLYGVERLRALILDLAVRGRLVPQDADDEPAEELLKKIRSERARLAGCKAIGKGRSFPTVSAQPPFAIPASWTWAQISDVGHDWGQAEPESDFTYIDIGSIDQSLGVVCSPSVLSASAAPSRARKIVQRGTVIYSTVRPYLLNIAIIDQDFEPQPIASTAFAILHPFVGLEAGYLFRYLRSPAFVRYVESCQTGIAYPAINDRQFFAAWFPLPPAAEQQRIVTKVDELMGLCDALEAQSASALDAHQALVEALLATLVTATDPADLARQWTRLEAHFDALFTTEASIETLKQTTFDLAVRGKLVKRDAGDNAIKLPKFRSVSSSSDWDEEVFHYGSKIFALPEGWVIAPLAQVSSHIIDCPHTTPKWTETGELCVRTNQIKSRHLDLSKPNYVSEETYNLRIERLKPREGDILYIREGGILGVGCKIPSGIKLCLGQRSMLIRCTEVILPEYLEILINSPFIVEQAAHWTTGGAAPRVNMSTVRGYPIPIPPLAEQHRIVAKVDALTALCDQFKSFLADAAQTQCHLADAITHKAAA